MQLIFSRSRTIGSPLIRLATWGTWSHCGILTPEQTVLEARWPQGVVETPVEQFRAHASHHAEATIATPDDAAGIAWARRQIGKPYDTFGVLSLGIQRDWEDPEKWWCSEFVEAALIAAGRRRFRHGSRRITPQHSWMVL